MFATSVEQFMAGLALGLVTGTTCLATCMPIYIPYMMQEGRQTLKSILTVLEISAGRFISYITFGIILGFVGKNIRDAAGGDFRTIFTAIAYICFSTLLIVSAFNKKKKEGGCPVSRWKRFAEKPLLLGLVTGINFCPSFLIAVTSAINLDGPLAGAMMFFGFFLGTSAYLLPLSIFGIMGNFKWIRKISVYASVAVGVFFISRAVVMFWDTLNPPAVQETRQAGPIVNILDDTPLFILHDEEADLSAVKEGLSASRRGEVLPVTSVDQIPESAYILVSTSRGAETPEVARNLKTGDRFVIIMSDPDSSSGYTEEYVQKLITFLDRYSFRHNREEGSIFSMSHVYSSPPQGDDSKGCTDENHTH
ncbi:MAG: sulfite exporter TauE/SafE family protein [Fibrobacterota bacterium]